MIKKLAVNYFSELYKTLECVSLENFEKIINVILSAYENEHTIFIMGNGGSGATASHFACDINKGVSFGLEKRFKVICLNDNTPTMLAYANDNSYSDIFVEQLKNYLKQNDVVIGISGSGNSENVIKALKYANEKAATSIAFTGFEGGYLHNIAKLSLVAPVNDMQKIEDIHLILTHLMMQFFYKSLRI